MGRRRHDAMQDVELVDVDLVAPGSGPAAGADGADGADDPMPRADPRTAWRHARRRRLVRRWWPVPVLVVGVLVATQATLNARERDRVAAVQALPGAVRHVVGPDLQVDTLAGEDGLWLLSSGAVVGDLWIGSAPADPGVARRVRAVDVRTGTDAWSTAVDTGPADPGVAGDPPDCSAGDEPVTVVRCHVTDGGTAPGDDSSAVAPTSARLLTLDVATGEVLDQRALPPASSAVVEGDALVVATVDDGSATITSEDRDTGARRWSTTVHAPDLRGAGTAATRPHLEVSGAHVLLGVAPTSWSLSARDGAVEAQAGLLAVGRSDRLITTELWTADGSAPFRLLGRDGTGTATVDGQPVRPVVDDGTVPDVDFVADPDGQGISGVDAATGRTLWQKQDAGRSLSGSGVLLDGVLYGAGSDTVWAVDAATGDPVWSAPAGPTSDWRSVLTDGRDLLVTERGPDGPALAGYALSSGARRWSATLPTAGGTLLTRAGELLAVSGDGTVLRVR